MTRPDICLIGGAGAGKTTAAKLLESYFDYTRLAFAGTSGAPHLDSPRDIVTQLWGREAMDDREKLVKIGIAARGLDPDVWLRALERQLETLAERRYDKVLVAPGAVIPSGIIPATPAVVDDCRFPNEYYMLRGRGFVVVRVVASFGVRMNRLKASGKWYDGCLDESIEHYLDDLPADYEVSGDGSIDALFTALGNILKREWQR